MGLYVVHGARSPVPARYPNVRIPMPVILLAVVILGALFMAGVVHPQRLFDSETKLGLFEERIASFTDEFVRRSDRLNRNFEQFEACGPKCESKQILSERDVIVREEWPSIFERLRVFKDWGEMRVSAEMRDNFFKLLKQHGETTLRDKCVPKIEYWWRVIGHRWKATHSFEGFDCKAAAAGSQSRQLFYFSSKSRQMELMQ